jgi:hypothetical protein
MISIGTCGSSFDTVLGVYTGSPVNSLSAVTSNDDGAMGCGEGSTESFLRMPATSGTHYRVTVDGKFAGSAAAEGPVRFTVHTPGLFDLFGNGQPASTQETGAFSGIDNFAAGTQASEPDHAGSAPFASMWFRYAPPTTRTTTITTCGSSFDTRLAVYTGNAINALTPVASNDDTTLCGDGRQSAVTFDAVAGTTYRYAIDGKPTSVGSIIVNFNPPANDSFAGVRDLTGPLPKTEDVASGSPASLEPGELHVRADDNGSFWWKWTAPASGTATADTCGTAYDSVVTVFTGTAVSALTQVASNDDASPSCATGKKADARVSFPAVAGTTYYFQVAGRGPGALAATKLTLDGPNTPAADPGGGPATGPGTGPGTPTPKLLQSVALPKPRSLRKLRRGKYAVVVRCRRACSVSAALTPRAKKKPVVARGKGKRASAGRVRIVLKLTKDGRKRLRRARSFNAMLRLRLVDTTQAGKVTHAKRRISFG